MFWTWLLLILYGGLGLANVARGVLAFSVNRVLARSTSLPFWLLGLIYILWGIGFLVCVAVVLWRRHPARRLVRGCAVAYQLTVWVIHVVGDVSTYARRLWLRDAFVSIVFLLAVFVTTHLSTRGAPRRSH